MKSLSIRDLFFLCVGFFISFWLFSSSSPDPAKPLPVAKTSDVEPTENREPNKQTNFISLHTGGKLQKLKFKSLKTSKELNKAQLSPQRKPTSANVVLSESNILELEDHLYELRYLVQTHLTSEGWLLQGKVTRSPFSHFGFQSGDVIRHESLDALKRRSDKFALAERFESVLRSLER